MDRSEHRRAAQPLQGTLRISQDFLSPLKGFFLNIHNTEGSSRQQPSQKNGGEKKKKEKNGKKWKNGGKKENNGKKMEKKSSKFPFPNTA